MATSTSTLRIIIDSKAKGDGGKKAKKGLDSLKDTVKFAAGAFVALKAAQGAVDFVKAGAAIQRQKTALDSLAASADTSGDAIVSAMQDASDHTIDRMSAMEAATKAMLLDVAKTPEAFARLTKVATQLGRAMGQDATKSIDDFVTAAGRQSKQIADNLGLMVSAGDANRRFAATNNISVDAMDDAAKKQAFLTEMIRQGELKTAEMGKTTMDAATRIEQATASWEDMKGTAQELSATFVAQTGILKALSDAMKQASALIDLMSIITKKTWETVGTATTGLFEYRQAFQDASFAVLKGGDAQEAFNNSLQQSKSALDAVLARHTKFQDDEDELRATLEATAAAQKKVTSETKALGKSFDLVSSDYINLISDTKAATNATEGLDLQMVLMTGNTKSVADGLARIAAVEREAAREADLLTQKMANFALEANMSFKQQFDSMAESAEEFATDREQLERDHQEKLSKLQARGQTRSIRIDAVAEQKKLETLQKRLEVSLLQQSEFTEKTKESTRLAKENQIATLQAQIGEQTTLLDNFHAGRLVTSGENVTALVEQEKLAHQERIADLVEAQRIQEEEQKQSLGRMILQSFESWATLKGIPADKMLEMRTAIAEEFGLIDKDTANKLGVMVQGWETWAAGVGTNVANANATMKTIKAEMDAIPTVKEITIRVRREATAAAFADPETAKQLGLQQGTRNFRGGFAMVGEAGPELVELPSGTKVFTAAETSKILRNAQGFQFGAGKRAVLPFEERKRRRDRLDAFLKEQEKGIADRPLPTLPTRPGLRRKNFEAEKLSELMAFLRNQGGGSRAATDGVTLGGLGGGGFSGGGNTIIVIQAPFMDARAIANEVAKQLRLTGQRRVPPISG